MVILTQSIRTPVFVPETCVVEVNQLKRWWHDSTPPFWLDPRWLHSRFLMMTDRPDEWVQKVSSACGRPGFDVRT